MKKLSAYLLCGLLTGCGGGGHFSQGYYRDEQTSYRIAEPDRSWTRLEVESGNDLAWHRERPEAIIQVNSACGLEMDIPLKALTNHLLIGFTEVAISEQGLIDLDGREALRTRLSAKLDGVRRELILTVLKKNGCVYDFTLVAPEPGAFAHALAAYDRVLSGFRSN